MKNVVPQSITGKGARFAEAGSVLKHRFGEGDPYTLGVEEEYMLLDGESFDLVQHVDTVLSAAQNGELTDRIGPELIRHEDQDIGSWHVRAVSRHELARH